MLESSPQGPRGGGQYQFSQARVLNIGVMNPTNLTNPYEPDEPTPTDEPLAEEQLFWRTPSQPQPGPEWLESYEKLHEHGVQQDRRHEQLQTPNLHECSPFATVWRHHLREGPYS